MRWMIVVLGAVLVAAEVEAKSEIAPDAREVLAAAVETMGGDAAVANVKGMRASYSGTFRMGVFESPFTSELLWVAPDNLRWTLDSPGFKGALGIEAGRPWSAFMSPSARCTGAASKAVEEWLLHQDLLLLRPLLHREDVAISLAGREEGRARVAVVFERGLRFELGFAVDHGKTTLVSIEGDMSLERGRLGRMKAVYSEPKTFGAIALPSRVVLETFDGDRRRETLTEVLSKVIWNPEVEKDAFHMPAAERMSASPETTDVPGCTALVVVHRGPYEEIGAVIGRAADVAAENGLMPMGPVVATYVDDPEKVVDPAERRTEIALPVMLMGKPPEGLPEGYAIRQVPAIHAAVLHLRGPYGKVEGEAIAKLFAWVGEQGLTQAGPPRVVYLHDPAGTEPEDQVCRIEVPIAK